MHARARVCSLSLSLSFPFLSLLPLSLFLVPASPSCHLPFEAIQPSNPALQVLPAPLKPILDAKGFERLHISLQDMGTEPLQDYYMRAHKFITAGDFNKTGMGHTKATFRSLRCTFARPITVRLRTPICVA